MAYKMTVRRKLAIASWDAPREGNIYGKMSLDVTNVMAYLKRKSEETGQKLTITHFVGRVMGEVLGQKPDLNGQIILGKYKPHKTVSVTFLVQIDDGADLSKVKVDNINKKSLAEVAQDLKNGAVKLRNHKDENYEKSKSFLRLLPTWLIKPMVSFTGYLTGVLGVSAKAFGLEAYPFGSCIVTSVGMLDLDEAFVPPTPFARSPFYITVPTIRKKPVVIGNEIQIRPMLDVTATIDHRFMDGYQGGEIAKIVRHYFAHPEHLDLCAKQSLPKKVAQTVS